MATLLCRNATLILWSLTTLPILAQVAVPRLPASEWRRVGNTVMDLGLAAPAGGPVERVWYSSDGSRLFARTRLGQVWQTADFESWQPATVDAPARGSSLSGPNGAFSITHPLRATRMYAAGADAYRSDDGGLNWTNLSRTGRESILGAALSDATVSPRDPEEIVVAGSHGIWRSVDGGEFWSGLNEGFPNLPVQRILAAPGSGQSIQIVAGGRELIWSAGEHVAWRGSSSLIFERENKLKEAAESILNIPITALSAAGDVVYAGGSGGQLFFSRDGGATWGRSGVIAGAAGIERIVIDPNEPNTAVAVSESIGRGRVLRTSTGGVFWEDLSGSLPSGIRVRGVALDRPSNAVYAATDRGVYFAYVDSSSVAWTSLRAGQATDVALDAEGNQLFAAFDGPGIFSTLAPHRMRDPRVVSAADRVARAAAPGSLLSVIGARVSAATIGDRNAPVLAASDMESQIQIPFDTAGTSVQLATKTPAGDRQFGLPLIAASPSIFVDPDGVPLVLNAETGLILDPKTPARSGSRLQILAAGLGRVRPEWPTGLPAPIESAPRVASPVTAYLDREPVDVSRATLAPGYVGMYLVEVQLPAIVNRGTAELFIETQGQQSNRIRIFLEP